MQTQQYKIQNKLTRYIESVSMYKNSRQDIHELQQKLKELPNGGITGTQIVTVTKTDKVTKQVTEAMEEHKCYSDMYKQLQTQLKSKRRNTMNFNKNIKTLISCVSIRIVQDILNSCEQTNKTKSQQTKTYGWKQFNVENFKNTLSGSFVQTKSMEELKQIKVMIDNLTWEQQIEKLRNKLKKNVKKQSQSLESPEQTQNKNVLQKLQFMKQSLFKDYEQYCLNTPSIVESATKNGQLTIKYHEDKKAVELQQRRLNGQNVEIKQQIQQLYAQNTYSEEVTSEMQLLRQKLNRTKNTQKEQDQLRLTLLENLSTEQLSKIESMRQQLLEIQQQRQMLKVQSDQIKDEEVQRKLAQLKQFQTFVQDKKVELDQQQTMTKTEILEKIHYVLFFLQQPDVESQQLFNTVKNIIKKHQIGIKESNQSNIKISNEFKYFIANVLKDFMLQLTRKIEVYFSDKIIKTAKEQDVIKILKLSIQNQDLQEYYSKFDEFAAEVKNNQFAAELTASEQSIEAKDLVI